MRYSYLSEKLNEARSALLAPHYQGEDADFIRAFGQCSHGFHQLDVSDLDETAQEWIKTILDCLDTTGLKDDAGLGLFAVKVGSMTREQKSAFADAVDQLAFRLDRLKFSN